MITESVIIPLLPGVDVEQEIQKLAVISTHQEGLLDAYWGLQAESEETLEILTCRAVPPPHFRHSVTLLFLTFHPNHCQQLAPPTNAPL
jgi:hypothetical protein